MPQAAANTRAHRRISRLTFLVVLSMASWIGFGTAAAVGETSVAPIDVALYGQLLEKHTRTVDDLALTRVDYRALGHSSDWKRVVRQVHDADPKNFGRDEKLAFWINAYNILAIDLVVQNYPIEGIKDLGSFFSPVWNQNVATIAGRKISLGGIEHEILRKMNEPLIHGAIVCASASCPPLARTPFRADHLQEDFAAAMRTWLSHPEKGIALDRRRNTIRLSKVFDWFEDDFEARGGVLEVIAEFLSPEDAKWVRGPGRKASIRYFDYDWSLNDLK